MFAQTIICVLLTALIFGCSRDRHLSGGENDWAETQYNPAADSLSTLKGEFGWRELRQPRDSCSVITSFGVMNGRLYEATSGHLFVSTDLGQSWNDNSWNLAGVRIYSLAHDKEIIYVGSDKGVFSSGISGEGWRKVGEWLDPEACHQLSFSNNTLCGGTASGRVFRFKTNTGTWERISTPVQEPFVYKLLDDRILLARGNKIFISDNCGDDWRSSTILDSAGTINGFSGSPFAIFVCAQRDLLISKDGGSTWASVTPRIPSHPVLDALESTNVTYVSTPMGVFCHRADHEGWWNSTKNIADLSFMRRSPSCIFALSRDSICLGRFIIRPPDTSAGNRVVLFRYADLGLPPSIDREHVIPSYESEDANQRSLGITLPRAPVAQSTSKALSYTIYLTRTGTVAVSRTSFFVHSGIHQPLRMNDLANEIIQIRTMIPLTRFTLKCDARTECSLLSEMFVWLGRVLADRFYLATGGGTYVGGLEIIAPMRKYIRGGTPGAQGASSIAFPPVKEVNEVSPELFIALAIERGGALRQSVGGGDGYESVSPEKARGMLLEKMRKNPDQLVVLHADPKATVQEFVDLYSLALEAGAKRVHISVGN